MPGFRSVPGTAVGRPCTARSATGRSMEQRLARIWDGRALSTNERPGGFLDAVGCPRCFVQERLVVLKERAAALAIMRRTLTDLLEAGAVAGEPPADAASGNGERPSPAGASAGPQQEAVDRMCAEIRELSIAVVDHPHWASVLRDIVVNAGMQLKKQTRPIEAGDVAEAA